MTSEDSIEETKSMVRRHARTPLYERLAAHPKSCVSRYGDKLKKKKKRRKKRRDPGDREMDGIYKGLCALGPISIPFEASSLHKEM